MACRAMPIPVLAVVIVTYSVLTTVEANYTLEIMAHGYRNPTHLSLGQQFFHYGCCEGDRDLPCSPCDNAFKFCVSNIIRDELDSCDIGYMESELVAEDDDDLTFSPGDDIGGLTNPLLFSGETWPGMIEVLFTVYDLDGSVTVDTQSDLVDIILITFVIAAVPSREDHFTEVMTFYGNFSELDLSFRLTCGQDFYGPECTVFCVDTNDTSGHYTCDSSTGGKVCLEGYSGTNCAECAPHHSCSSQGGYCIQPGECLCREGFIGSNCSVATHPCFLESCMNGGVCMSATDDPQDYVCECVAGYKGKNCADTDECVSDPCVHGNCTDLPMNYTCTCDAGYEGRNCEADTDDCALVLCGGHGQCVDGVGFFTCSCETGYSGELCEEFVPQEDTPMAIILGTSIAVLMALVTLSLLTLAIVWLRVRTRHLKGSNKALYSVPTSHNEAYGAILGEQKAVTQHGEAGSSGAPQTTSNVAYCSVMKAYDYPSPPVTDDNHSMVISQNEAYACIMTSNQAYAPHMTSSKDYALHNLPTGHIGATQGRKELQYATADDDGGLKHHQLVSDEPPHTYDYVLCQ